MADTPQVVVRASMTVGSTAHYTVPVGKKFIVRNIHIATRLTSTVYLEVASQIWLWNVALAANSTYDWSGFAVMDAGQTITGTSTAGAEARLSVSGVEVDA